MTDATIQKFWALVDRAGPQQCWNWKGRVGLGRHCHYGRFGNHLAHRFVWTLHTGQPVRPRVYIRHRCGNNVCVNPLHLFEVDVAPIHPELALALRTLYRTNDYSYEFLARKFSLPIKRVYDAIQI
jgi:hypothetical protein